MSLHHKLDLLYYLAFLAGQMVFILKLADLAARGHNAILTKRQYLQRNWVPLLTRVMLESAIFFLYRHYDPGTIIRMFTSWNPPFSFPQGAMPSLFLGYLSDSLLDWLSTFPKIPTWIKATIPAVPQEVVGHLTTKSTFTPTDGNLAETVAKTEMDVVAPIPSASMNPPKP